MLQDYPSRRVLLCLRYGIGDVVMERPVLEALRGALPHARITALGAEPATELLRGDDVVDEVVGIQRFGLSHRWDPGSEAARLRIVRWLDESDFDLFLDVHHAALGVGEVVWSRGIRSLEADEAAEARAVAAGADASAAIKAAVRVGWGMDVPDDRLPRLPLSWEDRQFAGELLARHGLREAEPVGFSPVASHALKRWPVERFARVADALVEETGLPLLLFCGPQHAVADELSARMRHPDRVVRIGALHLKHVAALLARCRSFFGNDTGLMHISAAVGTRTLGIFGPTSPGIYGPPQANASTVGAEGECPHRNGHSLHPPPCWAAGRCLIAERGCIEDVREEEVLGILTGAEEWAPLTAAR